MHLKKEKGAWHGAHYKIDELMYTEVRQHSRFSVVKRKRRKENENELGND